MSRRAAPIDGPTLHEREQQVLHGLCRQQSLGQIGRDLHLSPHTVKVWQMRLYRHLGAHSVLEALQLAWRRGFLGLCPTCRRPR